MSVFSWYVTGHPITQWLKTSHSWISFAHESAEKWGLRGHQLGRLDQGPEGRLQDGSTAQVVDKWVLAVAELSWAWGQRARFSMWAPLPVSFFIVGGMNTHEKGSESWEQAPHGQDLKARVQNLALALPPYSIVQVATEPGFKERGHDSFRRADCQRMEKPSYKATATLSLHSTTVLLSTASARALL